MTLEEKINIFLEAKKVNKNDYGGEDLVDLANKENEENNDNEEETQISAQDAWNRTPNDGLDDDIRDYYYRNTLDEEYDVLVPVELDNYLLEDLSWKENARLRIIKATLKYVDIESVKKAFPEHSNSSKKEIIKFLKERVDHLPENAKRKLVNSHLVNEANLKTSGGVIGGRVTGTVTGLGTGAGAAMATATGLEISSGVSTGSFVAALGAVLLLPIHIIIGIGTLALAAITGIAFGAAALSNKHNKRKRATMMSEKEIIRAVKADRKELGIDQNQVQENIKENIVEAHNIYSTIDKYEVIVDKIRKYSKKYETKEYKKDGPCGNQNCMPCTIATEDQIRGNFTLPRPVFSPNDIIFDKIDDFFKKDERIKFNSIDDLDKIIKEGERYYIHVNWSNSTGGHEFLLTKINNELYVIDGQGGLLAPVSSKKAKPYLTDINFNNSYIVRIDNRNIDDLLEYNDMKYFKPFTKDDYKDIGDTK